MGGMGCCRQGTSQPQADQVLWEGDELTSDSPRNIR